MPVVDDRSDTELLLDSQTEPEAFTELYRRHAEDLLRYFARRTRFASLGKGSCG